MESENEVRCCCCCGIACCCQREQMEQTPNQQIATLLEEQQAAENHKAVFFAPVPQALNPGQCIEVVGSPLEFCTRFEVNLVCGVSSTSDIAFHLNPRFDQHYIVRNSRHKDRWAQEETTNSFCNNNNKFPLQRQTVFKLLIFIAPKEFMVAINGEHFCTFIHRIPFTKIKSIQIYGDVIVNNVDIKELLKYPPNMIENVVTVPVMIKNNDDCVELLPNPFVGHLLHGFQTGWQLEIHGKVKLLPHSFYVNLQCGHQYWPHPIIPLHLNPRFNTLINAHSLIHNAWLNESWGAEERSPVFDFVPGREFHLIIRLESEHFSVWLDGKLEGEFKFRSNVQHQPIIIDTVYIQGDLTLFSVCMNTNAPNLLLR